MFSVEPTSPGSQPPRYETTSWIALSRHHRNDLWLHCISKPYLRVLVLILRVEFHSEFRNFPFRPKTQKMHKKEECGWNPSLNTQSLGDSLPGVERGDSRVFCERLGLPPHFSSCWTIAAWSLATTVGQMPATRGCTFYNSRSVRQPLLEPQKRGCTLWDISLWKALVVLQKGVALSGAVLSHLLADVQWTLPFFIPWGLVVELSSLHLPWEEEHFVSTSMGFCWPTWKRFSTAPGCFLFCP